MTEVRSQNGWTAPGRSVIATYTVPGTTLRIPLRTGDVSVVLLDYLARYHREVESLYNQPQDLWGYADRNVRGSSTVVSNHASGTAVDARAVKNGLGKRNTFTIAQGHALERLLASYEGVIRHGRGWTRPDPMHAEINAGAAEVKRIADKIRAAATPVAPTQQAAAPSTSLGGDAMYVKCQPDPKGPVWVAILTGPIFVGLSTPGEIASAEGEIKRGAVCQWVEPHTWMDLDRRSHNLCDNPRPVVIATQGT